MSICPPKQGPLAESSGYNKLVKDIQDKYNVGEDTAKGLADFSFFSKGDMPTMEEASTIIDKSVFFQEIKPIKEQIKDLFNKIIRRKPEDVGYRMGVAEGKQKTKAAVEAGQATAQQLKTQRAAEIKAHKDARKEFTDKLTDYLKSNDKLRARLSDKQVDAIARRANAIGVSENSYNKFVKYFEKIIANKDYEADLKIANKSQGDLKLSLADSAGFVNRMKLLDYERLSPDQLKEYNRLAQDYKNSTKSPGSENYKPFERESSEMALNKLEQAIHEDIIKETEQRYGVEGLTKEEADLMNDYMNSENKDEFQKNLKEAEKLKLREHLENTAKYSQMSLMDWINENQNKLSSYFGKGILGNFNTLADMDMSKITDSKDLAYTIKVIDNSITNNTIANISDAATISSAYTNIGKLVNATAGLYKTDIGSVRNALEASPILLKALLGDPKAIAALKEYTGYQKMVLAKSKADEATIELRKGYEKFLKKNKIKNDAEHDVFTGAYSSLLDVRTGFENEDFLHEKRQLENSIEIFSKSKKSENIEMANLLSKFYELHVKNYNTYNEFVNDFKNNDPSVHSAAEHMANEFNKIRDKYAEFTLASQGKQGDFSSRRYYNSKSYQTVSQTPIEGLSPEDLKNYNNKQEIIESGRNLERELKNGELPNNKVVDYRFMYKSAKAYQDILFEMESWDAKKMHNKMIKIDGYTNAFGTVENADSFTRMFDTQYKLASKGRINSDGLGNLYVVKTLRTLKNIGAPQALARLSQYVSQRAVLFNTWVQAGKHFRDVFNSYGKESLGLKKLDNIPLLKESTIGYRASEMGFMGTTETAETTGYNKLRRGAGAIVDDAYRLTGAARDISLIPLVKSDVRSAEISFLSYYLKYMNEAGVKINAKDLPTEHLKMDETRKLAVSYAEQQVDATQGVSNKIQQSRLLRNDSGEFMSEAARSIVMPFNNFASNTRARMIEDGFQILNGNKSQKKTAAIDLAGTLVEITAFQAANAFVISGVERYGIRVGLGKLFGLDPEKDNVYEYTAKQFRKFYTGIVREILFSGFGGGVEQVGMETLNKQIYNNIGHINKVANYLNIKSQMESGKDYYSWLKKDPFFTPQYTPPADNGVMSFTQNWGAYGIAIRNVDQAIDEGRAAFNAIGESEYEIKKQNKKPSPLSGRYGTGTFDEPTDKYLNMNERTFSGFMSLAHGLSTIGIAEEDIIRAGESKKRDVLRATKVPKR